MTIGALAALSLAERCEQLLSDRQQDFQAAISLAKGQGLNPKWVSLKSPERTLAWAVAWNLAPDPAHPDQTHKIIHIKGVEGLDAPFDSVWNRMTRPRPLRDPAEETTCLCDLAWSVACERRANWQPPGDQRVSGQAEAFRCLWDRYDRPIRNVIRSKYRAFPGLDVESYVNEAWAQVNANYWTVTAQRRFLGLCPIKNFIITVSTHLALRAIRQMGLERRYMERRQHDGSDDGQSSKEAADRFLHTESSRLAIMQGLATLPAKQALYAYCLLLLGFQQNAIADVWGISEAAISQQLDDALPRLGKRPEIGDALSIIEATVWEERPEDTDG